MLEALPSGCLRDKGAFRGSQGHLTGTVLMPSPRRGKNRGYSGSSGPKFMRAWGLLDVEWNMVLEGLVRREVSEPTLGVECSLKSMGPLRRSLGQVPERSCEQPFIYPRPPHCRGLPIVTKNTESSTPKQARRTGFRFGSTKG